MTSLPPIGAAIGFIALFGQAVLNGVVMVSYFNQLRCFASWGSKLRPISTGIRRVKLFRA